MAGNCAIVAPMSATVHPHAVKGYPAGFVQSLLDLGLGLPGDAPVLGIAGVQGTGKSTLAAQLTALARSRGQAVVALSIDDFYLTRGERRRLAASVHPLLATRGPAGSHDVGLACHTIAALKALQRGHTLALPAFDKIADERLPETDWPRQCGRPDLIVLEGWFLKVPAQDGADLQAPLNALERGQDPDGVWRGYCNRALASYAPLWSLIDHLVYLQPPGFEVVSQWRWEQEQALQAANPGRRAMDHAQVMRFIEFFERISRQALQTLPGIADTVVGIDAARRPNWPQAAPPASRMSP
jgi:D-glycerate 3-kinase